VTAERGSALHPLAAQDITEIWKYIAADNPLAARRVREEIHSAIRALVPFPRQGRERPDLTSRALRFILVREYLIALCAGGKAVVGCRGHARKAQSAGMAATLRARE
jgi:antitoxin ParD1/3/4/toxin ParE1/3/4